ncbi:uncharacterized protein LOC121774395 [Salvia splendens]|uniref:uncharacterized protein LOC121774395 n=1 Tax=Salvia splendens TaxID=180675 RepID=UPI001C27E471|nr:uncharacterized protein LOC121774395 [Salvia splendens]
MSGSNLETRSLIEKLRSFDSGGFFDLGHPLLNRMAESFVRAAGVAGKHHWFPNLRGAGGNSVEALSVHEEPHGIGAVLILGLLGYTNARSSDLLVPVGDSFTFIPILDYYVVYDNAMNL